jgi:outer membrane protein OmpU
MLKKLRLLLIIKLNKGVINMNNFKKIGLTALGTSLIASSAYAGALSVTGAASITFSGNDSGTGGNGWSMSDSVTFSGGGEMDNGWNVTVSYELDSSEHNATRQMDSRSVKIDTNGMGVVTFGGHGGSTAMGAVDDVMPTAYGESFDILSATNEQSTSTPFNAIGSAGDDNTFLYSSGDLVDGFSITASYVPANGTTEVESSTDFAVAYTGMEGLTIGFASGEDNASGATNNTDNTTMYVKYAYGPVTVGYQESEIDSTSTNNDDDFESMGITYQVSDDLTIGYTSSSYDAGDKTSDQENSNLSASYTMGGMTLSIAMAEEENRGGSTAAADDVEGYAINLAFAF